MAVESSLPSSVQSWKSAVFQAYGFDNIKLGLRAIPVLDYKSASKLELKQYLALRILRTSKNVDNFKSDNWIPQAFLSQSTRILDDKHEWKRYLKDVEDRIEVHKSSLSAFSLARAYQQQVSRKPHARVYQAELDSRIAVTPTKQGRPTRSTTNKASATPPEVDLAPNLAAISLHTPSSSSSSRNTVTDLGPGFQTPTSSSLGTPIGKLPPISPYSPLGKGFAEPAKDEQIVNTALLNFLTALTFWVPQVKATWTLHRAAFKIEGFFEARIDGYLEHIDGDTPLVIIEVKACVRSSSRNQIQMQEGAQLAAWICQCRSGGFLATSDINKRFVKHIRTHASSEIVAAS